MLHGERWKANSYQTLIRIFIHNFLFPPQVLFLRSVVLPNLSLERDKLRSDLLDSNQRSSDLAQEMDEQSARAEAAARNSIRWDIGIGGNESISRKMLAGKKGEMNVNIAVDFLWKFDNQTKAFLGKKVLCF